MSKDIVSKSKRATVRFCDGVSVDGYEMPDGSFRVGITTASLAAGFAENYLRRQVSTRFKALVGVGFSGQTEIAARVTQTGEREERTISTKDFLKFLRHADRAGKPEAGAILTALEDMALHDFFRDAFGHRPLSIEEKRNRFYEAYAAALTPQDWVQMDKQDALALIAWR